MKEKEELAALKAMIEKSDLVEVPSCTVEHDGCGAPILKSSGTILRHRSYMSEVNEKTQLLQKLAAKARKIHALEQELEKFKSPSSLKFLDTGRDE